MRPAFVGLLRATRRCLLPHRHGAKQACQESSVQCGCTTLHFLALSKHAVFSMLCSASGYHKGSRHCCAVPGSRS